MVEPSTLNAVLPAAFGFLGTIAGAVVTWANGASPRYAEQDQRARAALLALQRLSLDELTRSDENVDISEALMAAFYEATLACASAGIPAGFFSELVFVKLTNDEPIPSAGSLAAISPVDFFVAASTGINLLDQHRWRRRSQSEQEIARQASGDLREWLDSLAGDDDGNMGNGGRAGLV